ncbi:GIY-YIG nuclease family protein [Pseudoalteromonas sp. MIP2626]|uniref:GIY-YIG nuclease family protein n=1 Tax=Pseudoalteromonas sp. MIP2626 TaxID=2705464 RepID=UPI0015C8BE2F|nr:GIY-YIG nuclease family protein [Pseudoalteromonas sp. MIP2626]NYR14286.1 GIY-YIG nuclease family protein [Pseudoalteromonas sp. MIP2626]
MKDYYVYVYIDPRNHEEFYYGKGKGSRKNSHLFEDSDTEKSKRIKAIKGEGLEPIIRVIACKLSEHDALLVEKTLLWKLGKQLTNISSGHYSKNFRPHDSIHKKIPGFDYQNGLYYYNISECEYRNWDDYVKYGFISAGQAPRFRDAMLSFEVGDVIAAYYPKQKKLRGYLGIGKIKQKALPIKEVCIGETPLLALPLKCKNMSANSDSKENSEYVALVDWYVTLEREDGKFKSKSGIYTPQKVKASLENQPITIEFLESEFGIELSSLVI